MNPHSPSVERLYFVDWLRILAFAGLVVYHVGMYYVSWDFHVKSPFAGPGLEPWMKLSEPWRMSLLFMISGAATAYMLKGGPSLALIRRRSASLLLPLLLGMVLIVPPQSYFQVVQKFGYSGDYFEFLRLYFGRYRGFCSDNQCLILPTWNHLWFLPYLWVYTLLSCSLLAIWPGAIQAASRLLDYTLRGIGLIIIPTLLILAARLAFFERYPSTHALVGDWFNHVSYLGMFVCGAAFATSKVLWERLAAARWLALMLALVFWAVLVFERPAKPLEHAVVAIYQWCAIVAAFGFAKTYLNTDSPARRLLTEAVFPVYILHQTILIVASQAMLPLKLQPAIEGPLLILITFVVSYAAYLLVSSFKLLRPWFGLKSKKPDIHGPAGHA
jgi:surface polysaccharide O-acyltransferase-like enzyme